MTPETFERRSTQQSICAIDRIQTLEAQAGITVEATEGCHPPPSLKDRLDRIEILVLGSVETNGQRLDRIQFLEDRLF